MFKNETEYYVEYKYFLLLKVKFMGIAFPDVYYDRWMNECFVPFLCLFAPSLMLRSLMDQQTENLVKLIEVKHIQFLRFIFFQKEI